MLDSGRVCFAIRYAHGLAMTTNVEVLIFVESRYRVDRKRIKSTVFSVLEEQKIYSPLEVSVAIVGDRKMKALNKKYRQKETTTNVLSFSLAEGQNTYLPRRQTGLPAGKTGLPTGQGGVPNDILRLGDVVVSYPQVIREASASEVLVDDRIEELIRHGMLHLLGMHHE